MTESEALAYIFMISLVMALVVLVCALFWQKFLDWRDIKVWRRKRKKYRSQERR